MKNLMMLLCLLSSLHIPLAAQDYAPVHTSIGGVDTAWVRHLSTGLAPTHWEASRVFADSLGSVFVSGSAGVVKYTATGEIVWVSKESPAIGVDPLGCLITAKDVFSLSKHNAAGEILWQRSYSPIDADVKVVRSSSIDADGNIYVVGSEGFLAFQYDWIGDFVTVKYLPSGDTAWIRTYDGSAHGEDHPSAVCIDAAGNVIVTGSSLGLDSTRDYAVIKYSSNGELLWLMRYSKGTDSDDLAAAMALDDSGNVYVTGTSGTIKYSSYFVPDPIRDPARDRP